MNAAGAGAEADPPETAEPWDLIARAGGVLTADSAILDRRPGASTTTTMRNGQRVAGMALFDYVLDGDEADFIEPPESGSGATYHVRRVR